MTRTYPELISCPTGRNLYPLLLADHKSIEIQWRSNSHSPRNHVLFGIWRSPIAQWFLITIVRFGEVTYSSSGIYRGIMLFKVEPWNIHLASQWVSSNVWMLEWNVYETLLWLTIFWIIYNLDHRWCLKSPNIRLGWLVHLDSRSIFIALKWFSQRWWFDSFHSTSEVFLVLSWYSHSGCR